MSKKTKADLESQLKSLQGQLSDSKADVAAKQRHIQTMEKEAENLRKAIEAFNIPTEIKISDHALMRYCERVVGIDFAEIKAKMVSEELKKYVASLGTTGTYPVDGVQVVMKDNVIVTILD